MSEHSVSTKSTKSSSSSEDSTLHSEKSPFPDVAGSSQPPTGQIEGSIVATQRTPEEILQENERLRKMLEGVNVVINKRKYYGKNSNRKRQKTSELELHNEDQLRNMFRKRIFPHWKLKKPGWEAYNKKKRSICTRALRVSTPPAHMSDAVWWKTVGASAISDVWCAVVANIKQDFFKQISGE